MVKYHTTQESAEAAIEEEISKIRTMFCPLIHKNCVVNCMSFYIPKVRVDTESNGKIRFVSYSPCCLNPLVLKQED